MVGKKLGASRGGAMAAVGELSEDRRMNQQKKFALGGGSYCLYAPRYPCHQYLPGFADEVQIFDAVLPSL